MLIWLFIKTCSACNCACFFWYLCNLNFNGPAGRRHMAKKIIYSDKAPMPIGPYSQAVLVNDTLYVSGQIAADLAEGGNIAAETGKILENIGHILKAAGFDYTHIVKSSIFLRDMNDFGKVNEVYGTFFSENPPARETVQVARLPKDVNVEISVIAVK